MIHVLQKASLRDDFKTIDLILTKHHKWAEYKLDLAKLDKLIAANGPDWRFGGKPVKRQLKTSAMIKKDEKSTKTAENGTRPRCIFATKIFKKLTLVILNIVNNAFKHLMPSLMSKNLG